MAQGEFYARDKGTVYPFFGSDTAGLPNHRTEITLREAHLPGIERNLVLSLSMLVDEQNKTVKDSLITRLPILPAIGSLQEESIIVVHLRRYQAGNGRQMIVFLMNHMPKSIEDITGSSDIGFGNRQLEIAHLSVESLRQLSWCKRQRKVGRNPKTVEFKIRRKTDRTDNGARTDKHQHASLKMFVNKVNVDTRFTMNDNAHATIVKSKGWLLLNDKL